MYAPSLWRASKVHKPQAWRAILRHRIHESVRYYGDDRDATPQSLDYFCDCKFTILKRHYPTWRAVWAQDNAEFHCHFKDFQRICIYRATSDDCTSIMVGRDLTCITMMLDRLIASK